MMNLSFYVHLEPEYVNGTLFNVKAKRITQSMPAAPHYPVVKINLSVSEAAFRPLDVVNIDIPESAVSHPVTADIDDSGEVNDEH